MFQRPLGFAPRAVCACGLLAFCITAVPAPGWGRAETREPPLPEPLTVAPPNSLRPIVGERLSFQGRWLGIPIGYGWVEVKELVEVEGRQAYHIEAQGHTNEILSTFYPIHDVIHSYLDAESLTPLRFEKRQREGRYRADEVVTFDRAARKATYRSLLNQAVKEVDLPEAFQDLISALYWFRAQPLEPPQTLAVNIYTDEKIYRTKIVVGPVIRLELLKRGTFPCLLVEPKASFKGVLVKRGRVWAHLTTDEHRLPLLVNATTPWGPMSAVLDEASFPPALKRSK